jgi:hypothetical protein
MPWPSGLKFQNRYAFLNGAHFFDCYRAAEHPDDRPRVRESFTSKSDWETYVTRHDAMYHDPLLAARLGIAHQTKVLGELVGDFLERLDKRWRDGDADLKTVDFYRKICRRILQHFGAERAIDTIGSPDIVTYVDARLKASQSGGALIKKEVSALGTIYRDNGYSPPWVMRRGAIKTKARQRTPIETNTLLLFLRAMPAESLERDFCVLKFSTMLRNEELYAADVGDVNVKKRELEYRLRNKQGEIVQHVAYLNDAALEVVARRVAGRMKNQPLFELDGRRLTYTSLRKRFLRASTVATAEIRKTKKKAPAINITAVGSFRSKAITEAVDALQNVHSITAHLHHQTESTTRKNYYRPDRKKVLANSKRATRPLDDIMSKV